MCLLLLSRLLIMNGWWKCNSFWFWLCCTFPPSFCIKMKILAWYFYQWKYKDMNSSLLTAIFFELSGHSIKFKQVNTVLKQCNRCVHTRRMLNIGKCRFCSDWLAYCQGMPYICWAGTNWNIYSMPKWNNVFLLLLLNMTMFS